MSIQYFTLFRNFSLSSNDTMIHHLTYRERSASTLTHGESLVQTGIKSLICSYKLIESVFFIFRWNRVGLPSNIPSSGFKKEVGFWLSDDGWKNNILLINPWCNYTSIHVRQWVCHVALMNLVLCWTVIYASSLFCVMEKYKCRDW